MSQHGSDNDDAGPTGGDAGLWKKLDVLGKVVSGAVLGVIAMVIKCGADDIASAQRQGELVRGLMTDLTSSERGVRQDIALIALDHSVGRENPQMVVDVAERLVLDTTARTAAGGGGCAAFGSVALRILNKRDSTRGTQAFRILLERDTACASRVKQETIQRFEIAATVDSSVRAALRSDAETGERTAQASAVDSQAQAVTRLVAPVASSVVFIQFQGSVARVAVDSLRRRLADSGFAAPGVERITRHFTSSVRYFHREDSTLARRAASIATDFVTPRWRSALPIPVQDNSRGSFRTPRGQIEVWISVR